MLILGGRNSKSADNTIVTESLELNGTNQYISFIPSVATGRRKGVLSLWIKRLSASPTSIDSYFGINGGNQNIVFFIRTWDNRLQIESTACSGCTKLAYLFSSTFTLNVWHHIVVSIYTDASTASLGIRVYKNGSLVSQDTAQGIASGNHAIGNTISHILGRGFTTSITYANIRIAQPILIFDRSIQTGEVSINDFGQLEDSIWRPKFPTISFNSQDSFLNFKSSDGDTTTITDKSGNGNDWTAFNYSSNVTVNGYNTDVP